jgi:hypothetical protein
MPISRLDDYLGHQIPEPIGTVSDADPNFYDRYYFNLHGCDDELFLVTGLGQYPNLGVTDAFVSVSVGDTQHTVRASRHLTEDRMDASVGPLRVEVVEGLRSLRVICEPNEWGVAYDLLYEGSVRALEEPKTISRAGDRVTQETCRFAQVGTWTGTLEVTGRRYDVTPDRWLGARDHSWGIRPVGRPAPVDPGAQRPAGAAAGFFHNWLPMQFPDHMVKVTVDEDHDGNRVGQEAVRVWDIAADRPDEHLGRPEIRVEHHPGTREVASAEVWFSGAGASDLQVRVTPLRTVYLKGGSGYHYDGRWGHGVDQGSLVVEGVTHDLSTAARRAEVAWLNETLSRYETSDGRVGYGMFENLCARVYRPAGFETPDAVA